MTKHIDRQRAELLARRDALMLLPEPRTDEVWQKLDEYNEALAKLDEVAGLGDDRPHPRVKLRKVTGARAEEIGAEHDGRWLVSVRHEVDDEREQVLGTLADLPTAHGAATEYVAVQRFLADRLGGKR